MDTILQFRKRLRELEIGKGIVYRIRRCHHDQRLDDCRIDIRLESRQSAKALQPGLDCGERLTLPDIAESEIDREGELMHSSRLPRTGEHDRFPSGGL